MNHRTLLLIFEIGFGLIVIIVGIWGSVLFYQWRQTLNRSPVKIIYPAETQIDANIQTP